MHDPRDDIRKVIEWHVRCTQDPYQMLPCNFVPLIVGPSGSGKTHTIKSTIYEYEQYLNAENRSSEELYIPFVEIDATQLSAEGWSGQSLSEAIYSKVDHIDHAQQAIIYIDEIDKIAMKGDHNHHEVNRRLQANLLKWLDPNGHQYIRGPRSAEYLISTAQMTFIFSGAFEEIFRNKQLDKKELGFNADIKSFDPLDLYKQKLSWEDLKGYGLMPELVNRFNVLIQTEPYNKRQLNRISRTSYDRKFIEDTLGVKVNDREMIKNTLKDRSGARGISKAMYGQALRKYKLKGKRCLD